AARAADPAPDGNPAGPAPQPLAFASNHALALAGGRTLEYTATAETTPLLDKDGQAEAEFFSISYSLKQDDHARRPVTFAFNGGPRSPSVWLHRRPLRPRPVTVPPH